MDFKVVLGLLLIVGWQSIFAQSSFLDISEQTGTTNQGGHNIGISFCDFNNDYLEDIYVVCRTGKNHFYKNLGNGQFEEIANNIGLNFNGHSRTAVWGDLNNDGWEDVYLGNYNEPDILYLNNGDGTFRDITLQAGITNSARVFSVNFADVNLDGWLDIYVSNSNKDNVLYLNQGTDSLHFVNITKESGVADTRQCMGVVFFDMDNDGDDDLYVTHDANVPNTLYRNNGQGIFTEMAAAAGVDYRGFGMGVDAGDLNNDGWLDLYVTNLYENVLYINRGDGTFEDFTDYSDVGDNGMGWGTSLFDYNNDGLLDIYVGNDSYFYPDPNVLYENRGNLKFVVMPAEDPVSSMQGTYGVATGDLDDDGRQEIALANIGHRDNTQIFKNNAINYSWIGFLPEGVHCNRSAIGTRIELLDERGIWHYDQVTAGNGYAGQNSRKIHFGLRYARKIDSLKVIWPGGTPQVIAPPAINQYYTLQEGGELVPMELELSTAINEPVLLKPAVHIFPNPNQGTIFLEIPADWQEAVNWELWSLDGKLIEKGILSKGTNRIELSTNSATGIFQLQLQQGAEKVNRLVVIQK